MLAAMQNRTQHRLGTAEGGVYVRSLRRIAEHIWSEANLQAVLETPKKPRSTTLDIPPAADPLALLPVVPEMHENTRRSHPPSSQRKRRYVGGATTHNGDAWCFEFRQRREAPWNTGGHFGEEVVDDEVIKREANTHVGNDDVLMPMESVYSYQRNTVNTVLSDETSVLETNPWNDDPEQTKILTILDDPKKVKKERRSRTR